MTLAELLTRIEQAQEKICPVCGLDTSFRHRYECPVDQLDARTLLPLLAQIVKEQDEALEKITDKLGKEQPKAEQHFDHLGRKTKTVLLEEFNIGHPYVIAITARARVAELITKAGV